MLTKKLTAYLLGTLGLLLNGFALAYGGQRFGVPWELVVGVLAAEVVIVALFVAMWRRSHGSTPRHQPG